MAATLTHTNGDHKPQVVEKLIQTNSGQSPEMAGTVLQTNGDHKSQVADKLIQANSDHSPEMARVVPNVNDVRKDDINPDECVLHIIDKRTGREYMIPIKHNAVRALDFKAIEAPRKDLSNSADGDESGLRILDPGFMNTAVKQSRITFVNGKKGEIQYRGHPIESLVGQRSYEEVAYLLIWGHLPAEQERVNFSMSLATFPLPPPTVFEVIRSFPPSSPPIPMIVAGFAALEASQPDSIPAYRGKNLFMGNTVAVHHQTIRVISSIASICAAVYCHKLGRPFTPPQHDLSYVENVLLMMGHVETKTGRPNPKHVGFIQRLWTLTADHEMTSSTAAFLHTASSLNDPIMSLISGMASSWGILHGGAIEVAYKDIQRVGSISEVHEKINAVKSGQVRLFGYGHRIYKVTDPRYVFIHEMLEELKADITEDAVLSVALEIDRVASTDEYFTSRKLKANADLFASFVYKALGFPADFILPLSMISRTPGLMAHWQEAMSGSPCIWRPQQIYTGHVALPK